MNSPGAYTIILDEVIGKWLGPHFANSLSDNSLPYRMLAILLDDPWNESDDFKLSSERYFIVDITKPEICRKLDMLNGPYFNTIMKMLEMRMFNENCERNINRTENSSRTLV